MTIRSAFLIVLATAASAQAAAVTLTGTSYTKNFGTSETAATASAAGFEAYGGATATSMGTASTIAVGTSIDTSGNIRVVTDNNGGLAARPSGSFGDPGASLVFRAASTTGFENFNVAFDAGNYDAQGRTAIFSIQYALGTTPTVFTTLGTISSDTALNNNDGSPNVSYALPAAVADQSLNLVIRVVALTATSGSGSRDTFGIDNFSLTYTAVVVTPEPTSLGLLSIGGLAALRRRRA